MRRQGVVRLVLPEQGAVAAGARLDPKRVGDAHLDGDEQGVGRADERSPIVNQQDVTVDILRIQIHRRLPDDLSELLRREAREGRMLRIRGVVAPYRLRVGRANGEHDAEHQHGERKVANRSSRFRMSCRSHCPDPRVGAE